MSLRVTQTYRYDIVNELMFYSTFFRIKCATKLQINVKLNNCSLVLLFHNHLVLPNGNR